MLLARGGTIFVKHILSMVIERPRCIAGFARGVSVSLKEEIFVAVDNRDGTGVNIRSLHLLVTPFRMLMTS